MALRESKPSAFGYVYPSFSLKKPDGQWVSAASMMGPNGMLVAFMCNHCPYAQALWFRLVRDAAAMTAAGFGMVAINPNIHPDYPEDDPTQMQALMNEWALPFPYLVDDDQSVARMYDAQCTPDFYVLRSDMSLAYRGAYDDCWKDASQVQTPYILNTMIHHTQYGHMLYASTRPSIGCSIKWQSVA